MRRIFLLILAAALATLIPAHAEDGPRETVVGYMQALKWRDYMKALHYLGFELPPEAVKAMVPLIEQQQYFTWAVKDFRVLDVKRDGGLATVTVEETQFRDVFPTARAYIEANAPALSKVIAWGDNIVTERFVLVRLDGRWQFDNGHSGVQMDKVMKTLTGMMEMRPGAAKANEERVLQELGAFINTIGFGQLLQSLASAGPVVPMIGAIMVPNFARARVQGQTTACKSNLKNIATALEMYSTDNAGRFPAKLGPLVPNYLKHIPTCPAAGADTYSSGFSSSMKPDAYTIYCGGEHHAGAGMGMNYPQYTSTDGLRER